MYDIGGGGGDSGESCLTMSVAVAMLGDRGGGGGRRAVWWK